jgi:hypothetical protein
VCFSSVSSTSKTLSGRLQMAFGGVLLHATGKIFESSSSQMQVGKHCRRSRITACPGASIWPCHSGTLRAVHMSLFILRCNVVILLVRPVAATQSRINFSDCACILFAGTVAGAL